MTSSSGSNIELVEDMLLRGGDMTLASIRVDGTPHASTVNFASRGMAVYFAISIDSQKSHDIQHCARVAFTVNLPYHSWTEIRGLSVDGDASIVTDPEELDLAGTLLLKKYPQFASIISNLAQHPWPGMLFVRCDPVHVALLDYTKAFGHTDYFDVAPGTQ
jgi:general stress protein 26